MHNYSLGFSSCPNDTYIFDALVHQKIPAPYHLELIVEDVEHLNQRAALRALDLTKISIHAWFHLLDKYKLLPSGGAMGRGCGPLLISKDGKPIHQGKIALPGKLTTANLLFQLALQGDFEPVFMVFDEVMPAIIEGKVDAGVIIHESRFTFEQHGLQQIMDLGEWWEKETNLPLPLGGILVANDLALEEQIQLGHWIKESILYAVAHPEEPVSFIQEYAAEMDREVQANHIGLYVNEFSLDFGSEGRKAIEELYKRGQEAGVLPMITTALAEQMVPAL